MATYFWKTGNGIGRIRDTVARADAMEMAHKITSDCSTIGTHTICRYIKDSSNAHSSTSEVQSILALNTL